MAYSTINKSTDYFNTVTYTGSAGGQTISGVGHQPDFIWVKQRGDAGYDHSLHTSVSGLLKQLISNSTAAEITNTDTVTSNNADGFVLGDDTAGPSANSNNQNGKNYVAWNWKANGQGSSNTDGSINTTYTSVNTTAGFSISKYTGTGASATIGHGLGVAPNVIITKQLMMGYSQYMSLNTTDASQATGGALISSVSNTTYSCDGNSAINAGSGSTYIAYCFAEKTGYSKFGTYTGNANADGPFIYTGFKPAFVITKRTDTSGGHWVINDNKRNNQTPLTNPSNDWLYAGGNNEEYDATNYPMDLLSNGFKIRHTGGYQNTANNYLYMAFGQTLVGSNNIPATAR